MRFRGKLILFCYTLLFVLIGFFLLLLSLEIINIDDILRYVEKAKEIALFDLLLALAGIVSILVSLGLLSFIWSGMEKEKNIAFQTDYGQVSVSLFAIEDFIRRLYREKAEIKEIRPLVTVSKRGININLRVVIWSDTNVPRLSEDVQRTIRAKVQEMLGIEEPLNVRVHVSKIVERTEKGKKVEQGEPLPPYRNY